MKINKNTQTRVGAVNVLLRKIGSLDRKFYSKLQDGFNDGEQEYSYFYIQNNELWYFDAKANNQWKAKKGSFLEHNSNGHTLNTQLEYFMDFIKNGNPINIFSKYWGYSGISLNEIHSLAKELGIITDVCW